LVNWKIKWKNRLWPNFKHSPVTAFCRRDWENPTWHVTVCESNRCVIKLDMNPNKQTNTGLTYLNKQGGSKQDRKLVLSKKSTKKWNELTGKTYLFCEWLVIRQFSWWLSVEAKRTATVF
jgi:hypothetical protein